MHWRARRTRPRVEGPPYPSSSGLRTPRPRSQAAPVRHLGLHGAYVRTPTYPRAARPTGPRDHTHTRPSLRSSARLPPCHGTPVPASARSPPPASGSRGWVQCLLGGWDPLGCVSFEPRAVRPLVQALGCRPRQVFGFSLARAASSSESDPVGAHNLVPGDIDPPRRMRFRGDVLVAARARWRRTKVQTARKLA